MLTNYPTNGGNEDELTIATESSSNEPIVPYVQRNCFLPETSGSYQMAPIQLLRNQQPLSLKLMRCELESETPYPRYHTHIPRNDCLIRSNGKLLANRGLDSCHDSASWLDFQSASRHVNNTPCFNKEYIGTVPCSVGGELPCISCIANQNCHVNHDGRSNIRPTYFTGGSETCSSIVQNNACKIPTSSNTPENAFIIRSNSNSIMCENPLFEPSRNVTKPDRTGRESCYKKKHHYYRRKYPMKMRQLHRRCRRRDSNVSDNRFLVIIAFFFCLPLGVISLYYALQVNRALSKNEREEARIYSLKGRKYANTGVKIGITTISFVILFLIVKDKVPYSSLEYDYYLPDYAGA